MNGLSVLAAIAFLALMGGFGAAIAPFQLSLKWRKHWHGPLALIGSIGWCFGGLAWSRRSRIFTLGGWHWRWRSRTHSCWISESLRKRWRYWWRVGQAIAPVLRLETWHGSFELGLSEPDWTGIVLGWVAALPPVWAQRVRVTFQRSGGRSRGRAIWRGRLLAVLSCWVRYELKSRLGRP